MKLIFRLLLLSLLPWCTSSAQESPADSTSLADMMKSLLGMNQPRIGVLFQLWNSYQAKGGPADDGRYYDTFRIRRFEVKLSGNINENISYVGMVDFARAISTTPDAGRINVLQDANIMLSYSPAAKLTIGQFKYPLTLEGLEPSGKLDFVERAEVVRMFGDQRDIGVQVSGTMSQLDYAVGVFNGISHNKIDVNREKDFVGRIVFKPINELSFGGSVYVGRAGSDGGTPYHRAGGEFRYQSSRMKIVSEFLWARESEGEPLADMHGFYIASLYRLTNSTQVGMRYEYAGDHLENAKGIARHRYTVGVNHFLDEHDAAEIQLNVVVTEDRTTAWNTYVFLNVQVSL